jgi:hypothetical protein
VVGNLSHENNELRDIYKGDVKTSKKPQLFTWHKHCAHIDWGEKDAEREPRRG